MVVNGADGDGKGEGYAKYELSDDGDSAHIAKRVCEYSEQSRNVNLYLTFWIRRGLNDVKQFHIRDVVDINLSLKHDNQCFPIHLDSKYRVWK